MLKFPFHIALTLTVLPLQWLSSQSFTKITDPTNPVVADEVESGGGTWLDINNDGFLDLFVANGNLSNVNNALYLNLKNGNFKKVTSGSIVSDGGSSIGGAAGDYNADGKLDLFVTNRNNFGNFLYRGSGDSVFTKITSGNPVTDIANSNSSSWIDIDNDGDLDLFTVNFQSDNYLYLNSGSPNYTFTKIDSGAPVKDGGKFSIQGIWADYNNDRKPDLFIGNAGAENDVLYMNQGSGYFMPTTFADGKSTLGASWGDYDNDGDLDLFTAMFLNQKSYLYVNNGPPNYSFTRIDTGIVSNDAGNSVGSTWCDIDNDGDLDLFVANDGQNNFLYMNSGFPDYRFTKVTTGVIVNDGGNSFGCAPADYDNDGDIDIFVANRIVEKNFLYANDGNSNHWITVKLVGINTNTSAIGTKVRIKATMNGTSVWQMQEVMAQTGYNSQNLWLHFGLGDATVIDSLTIEWQSGSTEYYTAQQVDKLFTFTEGVGPTGVSRTNINAPEGFKLYQNYPNPFNPTTTVKFIIAENGEVTIKLFDSIGRMVRTVVRGTFIAGEHTAELNAENLPSGVYYCKIITSSFTDVKKIILAK